MDPERAPENHALIIGTSRFGQPLAVYKNRTYELMPVGPDVDRNDVAASDERPITSGESLLPDEDGAN